jgi:hypothetical protein
MWLRSNVNAKNDKGATPLHYAATNGSVSVIRLLIQKGAKIKAKNNNGGRALDAARLNGHVEAMCLLK